MPWFLCTILLISVFSTDRLLLVRPVPYEKRQFLGSVLVFEQRTKQRQFNGQINNDSCRHISVIFSGIDTLFSPFSEDIEIRASDPILKATEN